MELQQAPVQQYQHRKTPKIITSLSVLKFALWNYIKSIAPTSKTAEDQTIKSVH
jgi:hypothetical protein